MGHPSTLDTMFLATNLPQLMEANTVLGTGGIINLPSTLPRLFCKLLTMVL